MFNDTIGNRTHSHPSCNAVTQSAAPLRVPSTIRYNFYKPYDIKYSPNICETFSTSLWYVERL
jgi:hypothetical protein